MCWCFPQFKRSYVLIKCWWVRKRELPYDQKYKCKHSNKGCLFERNLKVSKADMSVICFEVFEHSNHDISKLRKAVVDKGIANNVSKPNDGNHSSPLVAKVCEYKDIDLWPPMTNTMLAYVFTFFITDVHCQTMKLTLSWSKLSLFLP